MLCYVRDLTATHTHIHTDWSVVDLDGSFIGCQEWITKMQAINMYLLSLGDDTRTATSWKVNSTGGDGKTILQMINKWL